MTETKTIEQVLDTEGSLLYKCTGSSMQPLISGGRDLVYIKKRTPDNLEKYDVVLFTRPDSKGGTEYVLHRILKVNPDGTYFIAGDNCIGGDTAEDEDILGVLEAVKRNGKIIRADNAGYRLYTYLWCAPYRLRFIILKLIRAPQRILQRRTHNKEKT